MRSSVRKDFLKWHAARVEENYVFDFKKELREYCRSDVDILRRSMLQFREDFIELENMDPLQYVTIASVCMTIYRSNYLPEEKIGVVRDVSRGEAYSKMSIAWLDWISKRDGLSIKHGLNGGEAHIPGVGKVDCFCANRVYEFQGCFWHGCAKCYSGDTINSQNQIDTLTLRKRTAEKGGKIRAAGFDLVEVWECELAKDRDFEKFYKTWDREIVDPLNPRDAFFGGRTNVTKQTYDFKEGEKGKYVDFVSLYPTVQFFKDYPTAHPTKILDPPQEYDESWFGFVKCSLTSKRPLSPCITGKNEMWTWCTNELNLAIEKGYEIKKIFEVWDFKERSADLFKGYVRRFMKIKMESSKLETGEGCTYKSVDEYKSIVKSKLGIDLGKIEFNAGKRAIAKMCLNSLWGKFGQRNNMKTVYVTEPVEFYRILLDDSVDDLNIQFINEDMVEMYYISKDQFFDNSRDTNIFIAAFTTSHARVMMYRDVLEPLREQVLGFDTDSVWYVEKDGGQKIKTGDSLGDATDELDGHHITDWYGSGPKSYSYATSDGKMVCRVKGFTLNHENSQYVNEKTMKRIIEGQKRRITIVNEQAITLDPATKRIVNRYQEKDFQLCYDKGVMVKTESGIDTLPYGY
ncbi:uncharacterized protein LOC111327883 [Stylophora pistillata]|uniref:uncharacterized protein LOC111327883 n=1 Tax=Stylophora pistillata TaxID=50429 RepID=UPI000C050D1F|nr:uncharacterized protein LOC111327883 [Stylophora pistillata]